MEQITGSFADLGGVFCPRRCSVMFVYIGGDTAAVLDDGLEDSMRDKQVPNFIRMNAIRVDEPIR